MSGFRRHLPHSKTGIFKKIVGVLFEKIDFRDIHYWLYSGTIFLYYDEIKKNIIIINNKLSEK
jgi:hypothetical protein